MKTIYMGLNTEPRFNFDIEKWKDTVKENSARRGESEGAQKFIEDNIDHIIRECDKAKELRAEIIKALEEDGECELSWICTGRTRHQMHAMQWRDALPEYEFEIGYNYQCIVRRRI